MEYIKHQNKTARQTESEMPRHQKSDDTLGQSVLKFSSSIFKTNWAFNHGNKKLRESYVFVVGVIIGICVEFSDPVLECILFKSHYICIILMAACFKNVH